MILTCDHGRGTNAEDWKHHGIKINASRSDMDGGDWTRYAC